jgi:hypothetical protein
MKEKIKEKLIKPKSKSRGRKPVFYEDIGFFGRRWQKKEKKGNKK